VRCSVPHSKERLSAEVLEWDPSPSVSEIVRAAARIALEQ